MIDVSESLTARGSFYSRRRVGVKENLEVHASVLQYFLEKFLSLSLLEILAEICSA